LQLHSPAGHPGAHVEAATVVAAAFVLVVDDVDAFVVDVVDVVDRVTTTAVVLLAPVFVPHDCFVGS